MLRQLHTNKDPIFITGKAGTGKSVLLQYFVQETEKNVVVCAPTGIAALNIGGQTIHSLFKIPPRFVQKQSLKPEKRITNLLKHIDIVIIDEISMVSPDLMDAIDHRLRQAKKNNIPFGGTQIIMFGDLYQLPPILADKGLLDYFEQNHGGYFFFNADVWKEISFTRQELTQIFRQKDSNFKTILNTIREGNISDEQLSELNQRARLTIPSEGVITLATNNYIVKKFNAAKLAKLQGEIYEYKAEVSGAFNESAFPTDEILCLKKSAQIMLLKNDKEKRWVNGTLGYIHSLAKKEIKVDIDGNIYSIPKETWGNVRHVYNEDTKVIENETSGSFQQYPLKLAWAITIHKSQRQTYTSVAIDMGSGAFEHGQAYVALSRCRTLEGLYLKRKILREDIIVEPRITEFMKAN